jgi:flagellar basal-body rod protein FlgB
MQLLFDSTSRLLGEMVQATGVRHRVLAGNLANVETPGYQAQEVTFDGVLAEVQGGVKVKTTVAPDAEAIPRRDGNSVDLDRQMVKLAQNTGWHTAMLQILSGRINLYKQAMRDRL